MKHTIARLAIAAALGLPFAAQADSTTLPDYSDLWYNPAESGWGAHITLQDNVIFMVLYVYDAQRQPRFFVASDMRSAAAGQPFTGALYSTTGSPFTGAFNPAAVNVTTVGDASITFTSAGTATLVYTVNGAMVTKSITRQSWRVPEYTGDYKGGLFASSTNCPSGLPSIAYPGQVKISQSGDVLTIDSTFQPGFAVSGVCKWTGKMSQLGTVVSINQGTYRCDFFEEPNTVSGTFSLTAIEANEAGFVGRYTANQGGSCNHAGYLGGVRRGYSDTPPSIPEPPQ